ncbi:MAG: threonine synthase [Bacillota bacterium]|nr:threonine synthase [Bacillota bacterium]MDI7248697.1 threonine synthase [Bacillota bacterium]
MGGQGLIARYRDFLPVGPRTPVITLGEGDTPLVPSRELGPRWGIDLYFKYEGANPTGSFKDRGMTVAVSLAVEKGARAVICASTGNTAASAAAYAARAGLVCLVVLPRGAVARGKLAQALVHGAKVLEIDGDFDAALAAVRQLVGTLPVTLVNSVNPHRIEGQKTGAFEICDSLAGAPAYLAIPVGNAGNITAYWKGFREYRQAGRSSRLPRMLGFQAAGAAPLVEGHPVPNPRTVATAIRIGNPASWQGAVEAVTGSGGLFEKVEDGEIMAAYRLLASREGIFAEPASCAAVAGVGKLAARGFFRPGEQVVCVLTGHGLKDPDSAAAGAPIGGPQGPLVPGPSAPGPAVAGPGVPALPARVEALAEAIRAALSSDGAQEDDAASPARGGSPGEGRPGAAPGGTGRGG